MCLHRRYNKRFTGNKGWKLLRQSTIDGRYYTGLVCAKCIDITETKFAVADTTPLGIDYDGKTNGYYPGGFHIFTRMKDAMMVNAYKCTASDLVLCKVKFRKQVAYGEVNWSSEMPKFPTVVAQECRVIERR